MEADRQRFLHGDPVRGFVRAWIGSLCFDVIIVWLRKNQVCQFAKNVLFHQNA